mmetsp:Transcript_176786/g.430066  ORF Transcript_176786/g.430066 Transcript_176786/m.430066 type:complete len:246 (-) Transcript_176786:48-785(-)
MSTPKGHPDLQNGMRANLMEMYAGSDDPDMLMKLLKAAVLRGSADGIAMVRLGWAQALQIRRDAVTNMGIVAALVASVALGLATSPLELPEEDEAWTARQRISMAETYLVLTSLSSVLALVATAMSLVWVKCSMILVHDADDALSFFGELPPGIVDVVLVVCIALMIPGLVVKSIFVFTSDASRVIFFGGLSLSLLLLAWYFACLVKAKRRQRAGLSQLSKMVADLVEEVSEGLKKTPHGGESTS